jgi:protein SCO1/2
MLAAALAGCSSAEGRSSQVVSGQSVETVANGNTLNQPVPAAAAGTRLVDQDGRRLSLRSLRGKTVVLAPLLTMCQETCPMTTANMHRAAEDSQRAGLSGQVVFLEVTVDPDRDTVHRMHAYAQLYGAVPNWRLATGNPTDVRALWKALGVPTAKAPTHEPVRDWLTGKLLKHPYDVHHQDVVVIIDRAGRLRWITIGHPDARGDRLPTTMQQFLNDEGQDNLTHPNAGGASSWTAHDVEQALRYVRSHDHRT